MTNVAAVVSIIQMFLSKSAAYSRSHITWVFRKTNANVLFSEEAMRFRIEMKDFPIS